MTGDVARGKVGILLHHLDGLPSSQFLEHHERRSLLDVPACPGMSKIVESKVFDFHLLARSVQYPTVDLLALGFSVSAVTRQYQTLSGGKPGVVMGALQIGRAPCRDRECLYV